MVYSRSKLIKHALFALYRKVYLFLFYRSRLTMPAIRRPHYVELELTNHCNLACIHCHRTLMDRSFGFMNLELFKKIVDEIASYPVCYLRLVGLGEPGLHPRLNEMMQYLYEKKVRVELTTNGVVLAKYSGEQILNWKLDHLGISVDGTDEKSYNTIRKHGNYLTVRDNIQKFYTIRNKENSKLPLVKVRNVIFPETTPEELKKFKQEWLNYADMVTFNVFTPNVEFVEYKNIKPCDDLFFTAHVRWDGRIALCADNFMYGKEQFIGDLNHTRLEHIWKSRKLNYVRISHRSKNFKYLSSCRKCFKNNHSESQVKTIKKNNQSRSPLINIIGKYIRLN